jgi:hypothetical protein
MTTLLLFHLAFANSPPVFPNRKPVRRGSLFKRNVKCRKSGCSCGQDPKARHNLSPARRQMQAYHCLSISELFVLTHCPRTAVALHVVSNSQVPWFGGFSYPFHLGTFRSSFWFLSDRSASRRFVPIPKQKSAPAIVVIRPSRATTANGCWLKMRCACESL